MHEKRFETNTDRDEIWKRAQRVGAFDRRERLQPEMAAVTGESDPERGIVAHLDPIHLV